MSHLADAAEYVISNDYGSTNAVQRKLRIGFPEAARLMDQLESLGTLGPHKGAGLHDVLIPGSGLQAALEMIEGI